MAELIFGRRQFGPTTVQKRVIEDLCGSTGEPFQRIFAPFTAVIVLKSCNSAAISDG
jgi:hypothetical protein